MLDTSIPVFLQGARHSVDTSDLPKWGKAGDGSFVHIIEDVTLQADFAAWQSEACQHPQQFTGKTLNAANVEVYRRYCRTCGCATTQALPYRSIENTTVTLIDEAKRDKLIDQYVRHRRDGLDEIASRAANRTQPDRRADYAEYLNSPEWRERRSAVMDRCDGLCEGCRKQNAADVHHLTYQHVRNEFLFELVGLCRDCHDRWHEKDA